MCVLAEGVTQDCALGHVVCSIGEAVLAESTYRVSCSGQVGAAVVFAVVLSESSYGALCSGRVVCSSGLLIGHVPIEQVVFAECTYSGVLPDKWRLAVVHLGLQRTL